MENVFDSLKLHTFDQIAETMGYEAECMGKKARVLFCSPSVNESLSEYDYDFARPMLEFREKDWAGVREAIEAKKDVKIKVRGKEYYALKIISDPVPAKDGCVYRVTLEPHDVGP